MAIKQIQNSTTGAFGVNAAKRTRYEKMETAYGTIPLNSYANGDTLQFVQIPSRNLIHAKFVTTAGDVLELFNSANLTAPLTWTLGANGAPQISYVIEYIRGTGTLPATAPDGSGVSAERGVLIQLHVTH